MAPLGGKVGPENWASAATVPNRLATTSRASSDFFIDILSFGKILVFLFEEFAELGPEWETSPHEHKTRQRHTPTADETHRDGAREIPTIEIVPIAVCKGNAVHRNETGGGAGEIILMEITRCRCVMRST